MVGGFSVVRFSETRTGRLSSDSPMLQTYSANILMKKKTFWGLREDVGETDERVEHSSTSINNVFKKKHQALVSS